MAQFSPIMDPLRDSFEDHVSDDLLDEFVVGKLSEADLAYVEEHLLICEQCRDRLVAVETFVSVMRTALENQERRLPDHRSASSTDS